MKNLIEWDDSLIKKYNISGPRYTSYPTVLSFEEGYSESEVVKAVKTTDNNNLSLIYIFLFVSSFVTTVVVIR